MTFNEAIAPTISDRISGASQTGPRLLTGRPPFPGYYKVRYATADLARSSQPFFGSFGVGTFAPRPAESVRVAPNVIATIASNSAWAGGLQIELVQALEDPSGHFARPDDHGADVALHSLVRLYEDPAAWMAAAERLKALGFDVCVAEEPGDARGHRYTADVRAIVGHYVEGVTLAPGELEELRRVPGLDVGQVTGKPAPLPGFYQFTYITNDFDRAMEDLTKIHGLAGFLQIRPLEVPLANGHLGRMNCALSYAGAMEIEVMNPIDGAVSIYTDMLPKDRYAIRHHHISRLFETYEDFEARGREFESMGNPLIADNSPGSRAVSRFYYIDMRRTLGHYLESAIFDPDTRQWIDTIPRI